MRIRNSHSAERPAGERMTALIDVVFLLLIFFMLTLKVLEPEGDFPMTMTQHGKAPAAKPAPRVPVTVRLIADEDGSLAQLQLGQRNLGHGDRAFDQLNFEISRLVGRSGSVAAEQLEIVIDSDYGLNYGHVIQAISACRGRLDEKTGRIVPYAEKIKFAPTRPAA